MQDGRRSLRTRSEIHITSPPHEIKVTASCWVPSFVQGFVRDLRVRWALEKVGLPYGERLIGTPKKASNDDRALQPFGQVPACEKDRPVLFAFGAIVSHIAEFSPASMPARRQGAGPARRPGCSRRWTPSSRR